MHPFFNIRKYKQYAMFPMVSQEILCNSLSICAAARSTESQKKHFQSLESSCGRDEKRRPQGQTLSELTAFQPSYCACFFKVCPWLSLQDVDEFFQTKRDINLALTSCTKNAADVSGIPPCLPHTVHLDTRLMHFWICLFCFFLQKFLDVVLTEQSKIMSQTFTCEKKWQTAVILNKASGLRIF